MVCESSAQQTARRPPIYAGPYTSTLNSLLKQPLPVSATLWMRKIDIDSPNGNDFDATLTAVNNAGTATTYAIKGSFGCANGLLEASLDDYDPSGTPSCREVSGTGVPGLCVSYWPQQCTGTFSYSTYENLDGVYELLISGWCGVQGDVVLVCSGTCAGLVQCSSALQQTVVQGGTIYMGNNSVLIADSGNNTFYSNSSQVTVLQSRNITIQSSAPEITINVNASTTIVNAPANTTNLNTGPLRTCTDWLSYVGTVSTNRTVNAIATPLTFGSIVIDTGDGGSTWSATGPSAVQYGGSLVGASYAMTYCLQEARVYLPANNAEEQVLFVQLVNITNGVDTPLGASVASSVTGRNANGTQGMLTSACGTFVTDAVRPGDEYALYVSAESLESGTASLVLRGGASFSLSFMPAGCTGVLNNITFNITVSFGNGTLIKPGYYINITTDESDGSFRINNEGLVDVTPNTAGTYPDRCLYGTRDDMGILTLHDSSVCAVDANGGTRVHSYVCCCQVAERQALEGLPLLSMRQTCTKRH